MLGRTGVQTLQVCEHRQTGAPRAMDLRDDEHVPGGGDIPKLPPARATSVGGGGCVVDLSAGNGPSSSDCMLAEDAQPHLRILVLIGRADPDVKGVLHCWNLELAQFGGPALPVFFSGAKL